MKPATLSSSLDPKNQLDYNFIMELFENVSEKQLIERLF